jgi:hypothetical protein
MRYTIATLLVLLALALIIATVTLQIIPQWLGLPGGILLLIAAAFVGVAQLGEGVKAWREMLFGGRRQPPGPASQMPAQSQEMTRSKRGLQEQHGQGGIQRQVMIDSDDGVQKQD